MNISIPSKYIQRPTLIVNEERVRTNIQHMSEKAQRNNLRFRPHFKTHQSNYIGNWFRDAGVKQITVSSVEMAQYFANGGWDDITIAFPINPLQLDAINELARKIQLHLIAESESCIEILSHQLRYPVNIWINVNTGYNRDGIDADDFPAIDSMINSLRRNDLLTLQGLLTHAGHTYDVHGKEQVSQIYQNGIQKMISLKEYQLSLGYENLEISIGDTPTCSLLDEFPGVNEIRPGTFVFYDQRQLGIGSCVEQDIAAAVACPVVGIYPRRNQIAIYGGAAHLSKDFNMMADGTRSYGRVAEIDSDGWGEMLPETNLFSISQEIGLIKTTPDICKKYKAGDIIYILPAHICLTVNALRHYLTLSGDMIDCMPI